MYESLKDNNNLLEEFKNHVKPFEQQNGKDKIIVNYETSKYLIKTIVLPTIYQKTLGSLNNNIGEIVLKVDKVESQNTRHEEEQEKLQESEFEVTMEEMSIEELEALAEKNQQIIDKNEEDINKVQEEQRKAELIEKIKQQQETISKQNLTLAELSEIKPQNKEDIGINE